LELAVGTRIAVHRGRVVPHVPDRRLPPRGITRQPGAIIAASSIPAMNPLGDDSLEIRLNPGPPARASDEPAPAQQAATGAQALGAIAMGALAIGALALGALAIGRLVIGRARVHRLEIDDLVVGRLRITESLETPNAPGSDPR
jgi:hypothetical protein